MARTITLSDVPSLSGQMQFWAYCGLDCTGTREVFDALHSRLDEETARTYAFERALQAPAMAMMRRGVLVNGIAQKRAVTDLKKELVRSVKAVNDLPELYEVWDGKELETGFCKANKGGAGRHRWPKGEPDATRVCSLCGAPRSKPSLFNPQSPVQNMRLFRDLYGLPSSCFRKKDGTFGVDEEALGRVAKKNPKLRPLTDAILEVRGIKKQLGFLDAKLSPDGRYMASFNVGAAWTGRWSSSKNPFNLGGNMQNISERHRYIFVPDLNCEMFYADLKQAESFLVAHLAGDEGYIDAHKTGDTHTYVARLLWPELPWTGDLKKDKAIAKDLSPEWDKAPGHDYRFQAKRIQHGGNYGLSPSGISAIAKIPRAAAQAAYENYHAAFPGIQVWQRATKADVAGSLPLRNPLGRRIRLFGRPWDEHTYKQGLAYRPQSGVADILDLSLWRLWKEHDPWTVQLLAQVHDAILGQYRKADREAAIMAIQDSMTIPTPILGADGVTRTMVIPVEIAVGGNWGKKGPDNPNGLEEVKL